MLDRLRDAGLLEGGRHAALARWSVDATLGHEAGEKTVRCFAPACGAMFIFAPGSANVGDANAATCTTCGLKQCVECGVAWAEHRGRSCAELRAARAGDDPETRALLARIVVACPGSCGQGLSKGEDINECNVLRCQTCRLYVCNLCGARLESGSFDAADPDHADASAHFWQRGTPCYQMLFGCKDEWLRKAAERNPPQAQEQQAAAGTGAAAAGGVGN